ncbi:hypothetical protein [Catonella massiliensis]|uniref:DUF2953 domain-containing protein n=1 Tax=Catonella massiliensis TaxID=2799636 RepID=A0ABS1IX79_9FIRM|nr:hypothetical protein [Catonella massiliensis]MBK5896510.1 hypothetical protein [Catonella massiliensis]
MGIIGVLLAILKVIGIILLSILGLLLIIILLFLFVPFVYKIRVKYVGKQLEADGEVSFLFRLLRARAIYKEELSYEAKAAFFTLISSKKADEDKEDGKERRKENKAADVKAEDTSLKTTEARTSTGITERKAAKVEADSKQVNNQPESIKQEDSNIVDGTQIDRKQEVCGQVNEENKVGKKAKRKKEKKQKSKKTKKKYNIFAKIEEIKEKIDAKWTAFKEDFLSLNNKKEAVLKFINAEGTADGIFYLLTQSKILVKMILPKKIKGWLRFGTGDVYTEGQYLTYLCFVYPLYAGKFDILPEWDEEVIEVDASFSGKIRMFAMLLIGLKLLFSKKVKALLRNFNRCKKSFAKA